MLSSFQFGSLLLCLPLVAVSAEPVDYIRHVRPILAARCFACHGPDDENREAGLRLDVREQAIQPLEDGLTAITPGDPEASELIARVLHSDEDLRMPPVGRDERLTQAEIQLLREWIKQGAVDAPHWAFVPPALAELPSLPSDWADSATDVFVLESIRRSNLTPSPPADRHQLIRRLSLDLRGLPCSIDEVDAFQRDSNPDAHERLVDRFLASPAFGERWARVWLDLARYADSAGYASDPLRRTIWRYRDWVIQALNRNQPFDQFTLEQIAGDLLPNPTPDQTLATAFHRNTMTNTEGGTDDEEFRVAAVKDRATTTVQVWMGLTLGCAQCHNHKYDPITQRDFYSLFAFFNQTQDTDLPAETPTAPIPTQEMIEQNQEIDAQIAELRRQINAPSPELKTDQLDWERSLATTTGWIPIHPIALAAESGASLTAVDDGTIRADGTLPANDSYRIEADTDNRTITALRIETIPDPKHPAKGAGRHPDGNFVLSKLLVESADPSAIAQPTSGRFVRIQLPGSSKILSLAEVQVFSNDRNVALQKPATQSSTDYSGEPSRAVDGNTNGDYFAHNSVTHTKTQDNPWWQVDLGQVTPIDHIVLWNRTDGRQQRRLDAAQVQILDDNSSVVWSSTIAKAPETSLPLDVTGWQTRPIASALSDHSQPDFPVFAAVKQDDPKNSGWAVGPKIQQPHEAIFIFEKPESSPAHTKLRVTLEHRFKQPNYLLAQFRISLTSDEAPIRRASVPAEILTIVDRPLENRSTEQVLAVEKYFRSIAPRFAPLREQIQALEKSRPTPPAVPILEELPPAKQRKTFVLTKGNFLLPAEEVTPDVPASLHPLPDSAPRNRLALAQWLTDERNPLTARVAVNRLWARLFGRGIVETEEDFGTQGSLPTHPEVLDELAIHFREHEWDVKHAIRTIVTTTTYRQSSKTTHQSMVADPANRLLTRAPRLRLDAETVRDQALALAGVLSTKMHGPSVFPYQPEGLWRAAFNGADRKWATSSREDRFRRGLYTFWRRTIPYPSMAAFDAPSREICTLRRTESNTPLQAFVTLNDPVYIEAAQALARRILRDGGSTIEQRVRFGLQLVLARPADPSAVATLVQLYESELEEFQTDDLRATAMATEPFGPLPTGHTAPEVAAWTVIANVLLNLDGVLTKG